MFAVCQHNIHLHTQTRYTMKKQPTSNHGQIINDLKQKIAKEYRTHGSILNRSRALRKKSLRSISRVMRAAFSFALAA